MNVLAATCKVINNANRSGHRQVKINATSENVIAFLSFMQQAGYIDRLTVHDDHKQRKIVLDLNGKLVKCGAICPKYNIKLRDIETWRSRILPARQFGHLVLTTSQGLLDQNGCLKRRIGGQVLGYFY